MTAILEKNQQGERWEAFYFLIIDVFIPAVGEGGF